MAWINYNDIKTVEFFFQLLSIRISRQQIRKLLDNPIGNSIRGVSDALDTLKIKNQAYKIPFEHIHNIPTPFITTLKNDKNSFCIVKNVSEEDVEILNFGKSKKIIIPINSLIKYWTGIILIAQANNTAYHEKLYKLKNCIDFLERKKYLFMIISIIIISMLSIYQKYDSYIFYHSILLWAATVISGVIIYKENYDNSFGNKFCKIGRYIDCKKIMQNGNFNLFISFNIAKLAFLLFSSLIVYSLISNNPTSLFFVCSYICVGCAIISIISQIYLKRWCLFCCTLDFVLIIDFILVIFFLYDKNINISTNDICIFVISIFTVYIQTFIITKLLDLYKSEKEFRNIYSYMFESNISNCIMENQRPAIKTNRDINNKGENTITIIISLYCKKCRNILQAYKELSKHAIVDIVFILQKRQKDEYETIIKLLSIFSEDGIEKGLILLQKWHNRHNIKDFENINMTNKGMSLFKKQQEYCKILNPEYTPMFVINGKILPTFYRIEDIKYLI